MANLIRKSCFGIGAETLCNAGKNYLNYIERIPGFFADPLMDKVYRDTLARRRIVGRNGSVLQMRRGPIGRVIARVLPPPLPALEPEIPGKWGVFVALDIYDDTGSSKIGALLIDYYSMNLYRFHSTVMPSSPYYATGDVFGAEFTLDNADYKEVMGAFTASTDWVSTLTGSSTVRDDPSYYRKVVTATSKVGNALAVAVTGEHQTIDDTTLAFGLATDISGSTPTTVVNHTSYETYVDNMGFQTKMVALPDPPGPTQPRYVSYASGPRSITGTAVSAMESFGWIAEDDYAFVASQRSRQYSSSINFNATTRALEWYVASGANDVITPVTGKTYYSDSTFLGSWYSGHVIPVVNPFFPEMNIVDLDTTDYYIHHNGTAYLIETVDTAAGEGFTSHMINYYKYPTGELSVLYAYTKTTPDGNQFGLVVIKNGVVWKNTYGYVGNLIKFGDSDTRFCYGDIRMIVIA